MLREYSLHSVNVQKNSHVVSTTCYRLTIQEVISTASEQRVKMTRLHTVITCFLNLLNTVLLLGTYVLKWSDCEIFMWVVNSLSIQAVKELVMLSILAVAME